MNSNNLTYPQIPIVEDSVSPNTTDDEDNNIVISPPPNKKRKLNNNNEFNIFNQLSDNINNLSLLTLPLGQNLVELKKKEYDTIKFNFKPSKFLTFPVLNKQKIIPKKRKLIEIEPIDHPTNEPLFGLKDYQAQQKLIHKHELEVAAKNSMLKNSNKNNNNNGNNNSNSVFKSDDPNSVTGRAHFIANVNAESMHQQHLEQQKEIQKLVQRMLPSRVTPIQLEKIEKIADDDGSLSPIIDFNKPNNVLNNDSNSEISELPNKNESPKIDKTIKKENNKNEMPSHNLLQPPPPMLEDHSDGSVFGEDIMNNSSNNNNSNDVKMKDKSIKNENINVRRSARNAKKETKKYNFDMGLSGSDNDDHEEEYLGIDDDMNGNSTWISSKKKDKKVSESERNELLQEYLKSFEENKKDFNKIVGKELDTTIPKNKKLTRKSYTVLEIDRILTRKQGVDKITGLDRFLYYVLWKGLSYLHCEWITEERLDKDPQGKPKLKRFLKKFPYKLYNAGDELVDPSYLTVDRILAGRPGPGYLKGNDLRFEYLIKWQGLNYENSRWEFLSDFQDDQKVYEFHQRNILPPDVWTPKIRPKPLSWKPFLEEHNLFKNDNKLHPWQVEGMNWLIFNWYNHRGSILADEMGLGKTVQIVTTLKKVSQVYSKGPFLIVAPLSTITHWKREFEAWTSLNPVIYQGKKQDRRVCHFFEFRYFDQKGRRLIENNAPYKFDVLITTYESCMLDEEIEKINWRVLVVDEAHRLKNSQSKLNKFLTNKCNFEHTVLLTGTPIQNNMNELFNLLNFVSPNEFNDFESFDSEYGQERLKNEKDVQKLHKVIKPFFLRRMKEDVAKFIPKKKETIIEVELTRVQKQYYRAILEKNREFLFRGITLQKNGPKLMNIAMQLRKVCNHPYLINGVLEKITGNERKTIPEYLKLLITSSGKFVLLDKLLPKLREQKSKILIFSQMRMTLDLIDQYLTWKSYPFERIDGQIVGNKRQSAIDRFCNPKSNIFVFLLTTKAGGVGLNLMAANTVIIFDSDWNPQNDIQAMARCHRIGQKQEVKVYRLITRGSYEKEMFIKASKKLGLGKAIMGNMSSDMNTMDSKNGKRYDSSEINQWLKHGAYDIFRGDDNEADKFCSSNIDDILSKRATDIEFDTNTGASSFSKATFVSSDAAAGIDMTDQEFWEKVLPVQLNPADMLKQLNDGSLKTSEDFNEFYSELEKQVDEVIDLREQGMLSKFVNNILNLLHQVTMNSNFTKEQRSKSQDWASYIENPRRYKREQKKKRLQKLKEMEQNKLKQNSIKSTEDGLDDGMLNFEQQKDNIFGNFVWRQKLAEKVIDAFLEVFGTNLNDNTFWKTVHEKIGSKRKRKKREVCCWCLAFLDLLSQKTLDVQDRGIYIDVKYQVRIMIPDSFSDDGYSENDDSDEEYRPNRNNLINPRQIVPTDFPSLFEKYFATLISKKSRTWGKLLRLSLLLRNRLYDISFDKLNDEIKIPNEIPGEKPKKWWTKEQDKNLVIGAAKHGVGNWNAIKTDETLGFARKCLQVQLEGEESDDEEKEDDEDDNNKENIIQAPDNYDPSVDGYKCCGSTIDKILYVQCDKCLYQFHGDCVGFNNAKDVPVIWLCDNCSDIWPKGGVLYKRLAAILNSMEMKKGIKGFQSLKRTKSLNELDSHMDVDDINNNYSYNNTPNNEIVNKKLRRYWDFTGREKHSIQRSIQQYGKLSWKEMKSRSDITNKTESQIECYYNSLMSQVEYIVKVDRLKELIKDYKIELPNDLYRKFLKHDKLRRKKMLGGKNNSDKKQSNKILSDNTKNHCKELITYILNNNNLNKKYFNDKNIKEIVNFDTLLNNLNNNVYRKPQEFFNDIISMLDQHVIRCRDDELILNAKKNVIDCLNKFKNIILNDYNNEKNNSSDSDLDDDDLEDDEDDIDNIDDENIIQRRIKILKSDLDTLLTESDIEKSFNLVRAEPLFDHNLTPQLSLKIWKRVIMWKHLLPVKELISDNPDSLDKLYKNNIAVDRNEIGTSSKLPEWWIPEIHDKLVVSMVLKHGLGNVKSIMNDNEFRNIVSSNNAREWKFFCKFLLDKKPIVRRLRYVAYILTNEGKEPKTNTFRFLQLEDILQKPLYPLTTTIQEYENAFYKWSNEIGVRYSNSGKLRSGFTSIRQDFNANNVNFDIKKFKPDKKPVININNLRNSMNTGYGGVILDDNKTNNNNENDIEMIDKNSNNKNNNNTQNSNKDKNNNNNNNKDSKDENDVKMKDNKESKDSKDTNKDNEDEDIDTDLYDDSDTYNPYGTSSYIGGSSSSLYNYGRSSSSLSHVSRRPRVNRYSSAYGNSTYRPSSSFYKSQKNNYSSYNNNRRALGHSNNNTRSSNSNYKRPSYKKSSYSTRSSNYTPTHTNIKSRHGKTLTLEYQSRRPAQTTSSKVKRGKRSKVVQLVSQYTHIERDDNGLVKTPFQGKGGVKIISLGRIEYRKPNFCSSKYIWPVGFESERLHPSYLNPDIRVLFISKILDGENGPRFSVEAADDLDNPIIAASASSCWTQIIRRVAMKRENSSRRKTHTVSGPEMFGYSSPLIQALIEELPNADRCNNYWRNRVSWKQQMDECRDE